MSMTIVDIDGPSLDRFIADIRHLAEQVEAGRVRRIAVAIDSLDGSFKMKAGEGIWSPPMGTPRAVAR